MSWVKKGRSRVRDDRVREMDEGKQRRKWQCEGIDRMQQEVGFSSQEENVEAKGKGSQKKT